MSPKCQYCLSSLVSSSTTRSIIAAKVWLQAQGIVGFVVDKTTIRRVVFNHFGLSLSTTIAPLPSTGRTTCQSPQFTPTWSHSPREKKKLKEALRFRLVKRVVATAVAETKKSTYFTHEDRIPLVARFSVHVRAGPQGPPSLLFSGG